MTTQEIAERLIACCRQGDFETVHNEFFTDDTLSIEPYETPDFPKEVKGLAAIKEKGEKWNNMVQEMHDITVSDALVAGNSFACTMQMDITMKDGKRMNMGELCIFKTKDGKIISEEFIM